MENRHIVIGIGGLAGSGKDTFFKILAKKMNFKRYALADKLKLEIREKLRKDYNIDILNCTREEKDRIRFELVNFGKDKRASSKGRHWIQILEREILPLKENICITDIRYDEYSHDEAFWLQSQMGGILVHVSIFDIVNGNKVFPSALNDEEAQNDPRLKKKADYIIEWPRIELLTEDKIFIKLDSYITEFLYWLDNERLKRQPTSLED